MGRMTLKENWKQTVEVGKAYFRQGLHELGAIFYGPGTAAQHPEYGMLHTKTPGEVATAFKTAKDRDVHSHDAAPRTVEDRVRDAERSGEMERSPEPEIERE